MIYAVDFDGTLITKNRKPNIPLFNFLIRMKAAGHVVILNTCRTGKGLNEAVTYCLNYGLIFTTINANHPSIITKFGGDTRKIYADYYIDDKAINPFAGNVIVAPIGYK